MTSKLFVMDLQLLCSSTYLAAPAIALKDDLAKLMVRFGIQTHRSVLPCRFITHAEQHQSKIAAVVQLTGI